MGKTGQKRKKRSYYAGAKKSRLHHSLQPGMKGFLITCNRREREAVTEAYKLLGEYAENLLGPESESQKCEDDAISSSDDEADDDPESALKKEVAALKSRTTEKRFQQVECGANNCIFIKTTVDDPTGLLHALFKDLYVTGCNKSRHILRILPVICTCRAAEDSLDKVLPDLLRPYFAIQTPPSYCLNFKVRNNNSVSRTSLLPIFVGHINKMSQNLKVDFDNPDLVISVDVIKTMCCISVVHDFGKFRKYNLQEVALLTQKGQTEGETKKSDDVAHASKPGDDTGRTTENKDGPATALDVREADADTRTAKILQTHSGSAALVTQSCEGFTQ